MNTLKELAQYVGKRFYVRLGGLSVEVLCEVKDAKSAYGAIRVLVIPVMGRGETWVSVDRLNVDEEVQS